MFVPSIEGRQGARGHPACCRLAAGPTVKSVHHALNVLRGSATGLRRFLTRAVLGAVILTVDRSLQVGGTCKGGAAARHVIRADAQDVHSGGVDVAVPFRLGWISLAAAADVISLLHRPLQLCNAAPDFSQFDDCGALFGCERGAAAAERSD